MPDGEDSKDDPPVSKAQAERARELRRRIAGHEPRSPREITDAAAEEERRREADEDKA